METAKKALTLKVFNEKGKESGEYSVSLAVAGRNISAQRGLVHEVVTSQRAEVRAGTHSTLSKGVMKGGNKKPWKQKGTGRARAGSNTSPVWVGGAVAHGPKPRDYTKRTSKRTRREALKLALLEKAENGNLKILEGKVSSFKKTKEFANLLNALGASGKKVLLAVSEDDTQACRNIADLSIVEAENLNVFDIVRNEVVVGTREAIELVSQRLERQ